MVTAKAMVLMGAMVGGITMNEVAAPEFIL